MIKVKSAISTPVLATATLSVALLALGIGFIAPTGEQSKLLYNNDLWCVSNFIEQEPTELLADGRPRKDKLLDGKDDWITREQVKAKSKEEAQEKARKNGLGAFEPSDKTELRTKLQPGSEDQTFFMSHFNEGATVPGPCLGTAGQQQTGMWLNDYLRKLCFNIDPVSTSLEDLMNEEVPNLVSGKCSDLANPNAITQEQIQQFLVKNKSIMAQDPLAAEAFMKAAAKYQVNPALMVGITFQESTLGNLGLGRINKNPGNVKTEYKILDADGISHGIKDKKGHSTFPDWSSGIFALGQKLRQNYLNKGDDTPVKISTRFLEGDKVQWATNVVKKMSEICK